MDRPSPESADRVWCPASPRSTPPPTRLLPLPTINPEEPYWSAPLRGRRCAIRSLCRGTYVNTKGKKGPPRFCPDAPFSALRSKRGVEKGVKADFAGNTHGH